ncbi:hypothetical protein GCM10010912_62020 [Paenibacillus albidus]|uniref:Uncharacterized protein n=1 Tax=Paenibacillus albidus TaxID=2041023 RepID=A0A917D353_9BACL|nr:hypothetical protein GCM10010912_62020 [Paenibacillus albidus]
MNNNVAISTTPLTRAKKAIAISTETAEAIKLTMGTPTTIAADTPIKTFETALGASFLLTEAAATEKAIEQ